MVSYMGFAEWLANVNSEGATDEEFAEFFVYLYKVWKGKEKSLGLSDLEMKNAPIDEITNWIRDSLHEIIDQDSDCCQSAWWKQ